MEHAFNFTLNECGGARAHLERPRARASRFGWMLWSIAESAWSTAPLVMPSSHLILQQGHRARSRVSRAKRLVAAVGGSGGCVLRWRNLRPARVLVT